MLKASNIHYTFPGGKTLNFPSFELSENEHVLLLGKSGSGKTTLLHLIGGLLQLQEGEVVVDETRISEKKGTALDGFRGRYIGFVFQKPYLIKSLSVIDNLLVAQQLAGVGVDRQKVTRMLKELDLWEERNKKPTRLSQGQQQRVAVARALVNNPKLLLADEPTASLDDDNAHTVLDLLISQANHHKANLIIATHDARVKDRIEKHIAL